MTIETSNVGPNVVMTVRDTGTGMNAETKAHLFEPFFTTKPVGQGTGLGLSTVYGIVKELGGSIKVDSEIGAGSVFTISVPATGREAQLLQPPTESKPRSPHLPTVPR